MISDDAAAPAQVALESSAAPAAPAPAPVPAPAPAPVATLPESVHEEIVKPNLEQQPKRIIAIAIDNSNHSAYAFDWALENVVDVARDQVVLLNVRPFPGASRPTAFSYMDFSDRIDEIEEANKLESHSLLKQFGGQLLKRNISCRAIALRGDPRDEIIVKLEEIKADMIIMGSRGMGALKRAFMGSVSDHLVHHAPCAVVVTRTP
ncbi:uncharacterized protein BJ171DRAFT_562171 [Polychytrium aggregatum]|uniref:uncharacterized protein n=1 Tax=Polychytrium aggregatum TaxID=110093 RepID=UPI0022FE5BA4|nr:uncharacterized protein BJ171DRAFT_562171 [Polychytrium aggregatum]KAI9203835.1 hypothetical protein BJ171DRAFT_562171 [Polychytrium aggregatum]